MRGRSAGASTTPAVALLAVALLTGCSGADGTLDRAIDDGASAGTSAVLALELQQRGRATPQLAGTALEDARAELLDAERSVAEAAVDPALAGRRDAVLDGLRDVLEALLAAKDDGPTDDAVRRIDDAADRLAALRGQAS